VLILIVDQDERAAIVVAERIDAHQISGPSNRHERKRSKTVVEACPVGLPLAFSQLR